MRRAILILLLALFPAFPAYPVPKEIEDALKLNHINHFDEALGVIERALLEERIKPDITSAYTLGRILYRKGEFYREVGALSVLTDLGNFQQIHEREKSPPDEVKLFLGIGYFFKGRYLDAAGILSQVAGSGKMNREIAGLANTYLGASYYREGEKAKAQEVWKGVKKENPLAYSTLGCLYASLGINPSAGEEMAREALERAGGAGGAGRILNTLRVNHAYTLLSVGRFGDAYALAKGVNLDTSVYVYRQDENKEIRFYDPQLLLNYSSILFGEAIKNLEPIVTASSGELAGFAAYYVAQMYLYLGNLEKSMKYAQKAKKLSVGSSLTMVRASACEAALEILSGRDKKGLKLLEGEADRIHGKPSMLLELVQVVISSGVEYGRVKDLVSRIESYVGDIRWETTRRDIALQGELAFYARRSDEALYHLEMARDKGNKNKIETNDPNFLLTLSYVYFTKELFPESLEILFSLGKKFTGLRQLQDAVQSVYSYKQKGSGEALIQ
jgi:tetratricopeptide (TPR) repeat protein